MNTNMSIVGGSQWKDTTKLAKDKKQTRSESRRMSKEEVAEQLRQNTAVQKLVADSSFVAVNLYSKSIFGEDALANVSIEKIGGRLAGSVRIRSRTQGIALSLG